MPAEVQAAFPFLFTYKSGIEIALLRKMISLMEFSVGPNQFRNSLKESYKLKYTEMELQFYSCLTAIKKKQAGQRGARETLVSFDTPIIFPDFKDIHGYAGRIPSAKLLRRAIILDSQRKNAFYTLEMQRRSGRILAIDHSFKFAKHLQQAGDCKMFTGLFSGSTD